MAKTWLITSVGTGLGRHIAEEAAKQGNTVIGTVTKAEQIELMNNLYPKMTFGHLMDTSNPEQIEHGIKFILGDFKRIDVLVNNAEFGVFGAVEELTMHEIRQQMEVNYYNVINMLKAILPIFREQKSGHILQISSIAGLSGIAGLGGYCAGKHALEGLSESLYSELLPLGIKVSIIEPGPFRYEWIEPSMKETGRTIDDYKETAGKAKYLLTKDIDIQPGDPINAAKAIVNIASENNPPLRVLVGRTAIDYIHKKLDWVRRDILESEKTII